MVLLTYLLTFNNRRRHLTISDRTPWSPERKKLPITDTHHRPAKPPYLLNNFTLLLLHYEHQPLFIHFLPLKEKYSSS